MSSTLRIIRLWPLAVLACLSMATVGVVLASSADARSSTKRASHSKKSTKRSKSCAFGSERYIGNYFQMTSLRVASVSCRESRKLVHAVWRCSTRKSRIGRCKTKVRKFKCTEGRRKYSRIGDEKVSFGVRMSCTRGKRKVSYTYIQDLGKRS